MVQQCGNTGGGSDSGGGCETGTIGSLLHSTCRDLRLTVVRLFEVKVGPNENLDCTRLDYYKIILPAPEIHTLLPVQVGSW